MDDPIRLLMIDDDAFMGGTVRRMLAGEDDIAFDYCADPLEALAAAKRVRPALVLLDVDMPKQDGVAVLEALRQSAGTEDVPVVMLSAREEPAGKALAFAHGANDYIVKFPSSIELVARIRHHAGGYMARQQRDAAFRALEQSERRLAALNDELAAEVARSDKLLLNILPAKIAAELKRAGRVDAELHEDVVVMFTDFTPFTRIAERLSPQELVQELNTCFSAFDAIAGRHGLEKLKTIGDGYLCVAGLTDTQPTAVEDVLNAALEMREWIRARKAEVEAAGRPYWDVRIGVHAGRVVAGVIGVSKFAFDVWGDTVNIAARLEAAGEAGHINVSRTVRDRVSPAWRCLSRGVLPMKNRSGMEMFFVDRLAD